MMFSSVDMTGTAFRAIVSHLVDMEERKEHIVNELYPGASAERDEFRNWIEAYVKSLEELVEKVQVTERPTRERLKELDYLPFVTIGSMVVLEDLHSGSLRPYKLLSPYETSRRHTDISYLTPLGRALLRKEAGDEIRADINGKAESFRIKSIKYELL